MIVIFYGRLQRSNNQYSYNEHIAEYVSGSPGSISSDLKAWIDRILGNIPKNSAVLEIGSGFGRDAQYIKSKGYKVILTDASVGFVDFLKSQGIEAKLLNALTDDLGKGYDLIYAQAVFLHFPKELISNVLGKCYEALNNNGILAFSVKQGSGSNWSNKKLNAPRYFYYWDKKSIEKEMSDSKFKLIEITERETSTDKWLQIIAKKA